jgi:AraC family transcriptional regulator, transcriptional activator of pobA
MPLFAIKILVTNPKTIQNVPVYSIDKFNRKPEKGLPYQIEVFDKHRDFKVSYPHRHDDFYEMLFITKGNGVYTIDARKYPIEPNSIFFLSPGQIHELELSDDVEGYIFLFTSAFYHFNKTNPYKLYELPFFYTLGDETPPLRLEKKEQVASLSELFLKAIEEGNQRLADVDEAVRALLDLLLIYCQRQYPVRQEEKSGKGKVLVKRFKQLVEEKCTDNLSVKEYADLLSVSPNHLSETVKELTGRTSTDLINDRMVMEIKQMLTHTNLSVSEIAYQLHFSDQSYFAKYFKKLTGLSPLEFRRGVC